MLPKQDRRVFMQISNALLHKMYNKPPGWNFVYYKEILQNLLDKGQDIQDGKR